LEKIHFVFGILIRERRKSYSCTEIDYEEERREGVDGMHLAQDRVNTVRNVGVSLLAASVSFLTNDFAPRS
jgi:hypothetical protein